MFTFIFSDTYLTCLLKEKNIDPGKHAVLKRAIHSIESAIECQKICQEDGRCNSFAYNTVKKRCNLKKRKIEAAIINIDDKYTSGPKICSKYIV